MYFILAGPNPKCANKINIPIAIINLITIYIIRLRCGLDINLVLI